MREKKIVSIEDRMPKLKQKRRQKANRRLILYLSLFFILISVIIYLQSPLSNINSIEVHGNSYLTDDEIIKLSQLTNETNIWKVKKKEVQSVILENPVVKTVEVTHKLPSTLSIRVQEHALLGYVKDQEKFKPLFENGEKIELGNRQLIGDAPILISFTDEQVLKDMTAQLQKLPTNILRLISEIHWNPEKDQQHKVFLYMVDGYIVEGTIRNFAEKMQVYPSIVSQLDEGTKGIIHIGVGAYFEQIESKQNETKAKKNEQTEDTDEQSESEQ